MSDRGTSHQLQVVALRMPLHLINKISNDGNDGRVNLQLPTHLSGDVRPDFLEENFTLRSQCLVHLNDAAKEASSSTRPSAESLLLFLYEHNNSVPHMIQDPWSLGGDNIQQLGPAAWTDFPAHHFFTRVYRPSAVAAGLLNRRPIFCSEQEWLSIPWQRHPKGRFDELLDIMLQISALLQRVDQHVLGLVESSSFDCNDLLGSCLIVEAQLEQWYNSACHTLNMSSRLPTFWISPDQTTAEFPFTDILAFRDGHTALLLIYYWTAQICLYPCIELLSHETGHSVADNRFLQQATDSSSKPLDYSLQYQHPQQQHLSSDSSIPPAWTQPHLQDDVNYGILYGPQKVREIAAKICRGLDYAIQNTMQPDLFAFPAQVVENVFFSGLGFDNALAAAAASPSQMQHISGSGVQNNSSNLGNPDNTLELLWLDDFRARMAIRGQEIAEMVTARRWMTLAEW